MSRLKDVITDSIQSYEYISKSKQLKNVRRSNISRIVHLIDQDPQLKSQVQDIISKKTYYVNKLNKMIDSVIEKKGGNCSIAEDSPLDARHITSRFHAKKYLSFLKPDELNQLKNMIEKHHEFQTYQKEARDKMIKDPNYNDIELKEKLQIWAQNTYEIQLDLQDSSIKLLKELDIPFFALATDWEYPGLEQDKLWILQYIQTQLVPSLTAKTTATTIISK